jgi:hypothetical protein
MDDDASAADKRMWSSRAQKAHGAMHHGSKYHLTRADRIYAKLGSNRCVDNMQVITANLFTLYSAFSNCVEAPRPRPCTVAVTVASSLYHAALLRAVTCALFGSCCVTKSQKKNNQQHSMKKAPTGKPHKRLDQRLVKLHARVKTAERMQKDCVIVPYR